MKSRLQSTRCLSNSALHREGGTAHCRWWARIDDRFLALPNVRGDELLDVVVDLPPGTEVQIGVGKALRKPGDRVRETVVTGEPLENLNDE